jgi:hypothetical protein
MQARGKCLAQRFASFLRFWAVAASRNSSRAPLETAQSEATESEDALEMGEQHPDLLPAMTRTFVGRRASFQLSDNDRTSASG